MWPAGVDINKQNVDNSKWGTSLSSAATDSDLWRTNNSMTSGWGSVNQSPVPNAGTEGWSSTLHSQPNQNSNPSTLPQNDNRLNFGGFQSNNHPATQQQQPSAAAWGVATMGPAGAWSRGNPMSNQAATSSSSSTTTNNNQTLALGGGPSSWAEAVASKQSSNNSNSSGSAPAVVNVSASTASNQSMSSAQATSNDESSSSSSSSSSTVSQKKKTQEEIIAMAINSNEGWGKTVIRQDTAWIIDDPPATNESSYKDSHSESEHQTAATALTTKQIITGTAIWESLKTTQKPAEASSSSSSTASSSWDSNKTVLPNGPNQDISQTSSTFIRPASLDSNKSSTNWPSQTTTNVNNNSNNNISATTSNLSWGSSIPDAAWSDRSADATSQVLKKEDDRSLWGLQGASDIGSKSSTDLGVSCWERPNIPLHRSSSTGSWIDEATVPNLDISGTRAWADDKSGSQSILNEIDDGTSLWGEKAAPHSADGWRPVSVMSGKSGSVGNMRKSESDVFSSSNPSNPLGFKLGYPGGPLDELTRPWNPSVPPPRTDNNSNWGAVDNSNSWMGLLGAQNNNNSSSNNNNSNSNSNLNNINNNNNNINNNNNNNNNSSVPRLKPPMSGWSDVPDWSNRMNQPPQRHASIQKLIQMGFKKEDAMSALISNNMNIDEAMANLMKSNLRNQQSIHDLSSASSSSSSQGRFNPHGGAGRPGGGIDDVINNIDNPMDLFSLTNLQSLNLAGNSGGSINNSGNNANNSNINNSINVAASSLIGQLRGGGVNNSNNNNNSSNNMNNSNNNNNSSSGVNGHNINNNNNSSNPVLHPFPSSLDISSMHQTGPMMTQLGKPPPPIGAQLNNNVIGNNVINNNNISNMPLPTLPHQQQQQFMQHLLQSVQSAVQLNLIPPQVVNQHTITNASFITMVQGLLKLNEAYQKLVLQSIQQVPPPTHPTPGGMLQQQRQMELTMNILQQRIEALKQQILQTAATTTISSISSTPSTPNLGSVGAPTTIGSRLISQWKVSDNNNNNNNNSSNNNNDGGGVKLQHSLSMMESSGDMSLSSTTSAANLSSSNLATWLPMASSSSSTSSSSAWLDSNMDQKSAASSSSMANVAAAISTSGVTLSATVTSSATSSSSSANQTSNANELASSAIAVVPLLDIEEFIPGKPWQGPGTKNVEDDPYITPGSIINSISTVKDTTLLHKSSSSAGSLGNSGKGSGNNANNPSLLSSSSTLSSSATSTGMPSSSLYTTPSFGQPMPPPPFPISKLGTQWGISDNSNNNIVRGPPPPPPSLSNDLWSSSSSATAASFSINNNKQNAMNNNHSGHNWNSINRSISWASGDRADVNNASVAAAAAVAGGPMPNSWSSGPSNWILIKGIPQIDPTALQNLCLQNGAISTLPNFYQGQLLAGFQRIEESVKVLRQLNAIRYGANSVRAEFISDADVTQIISRMQQLASSNGLAAAAAIAGGGMVGGASSALMGGAGLLGGGPPGVNNNAGGGAGGGNGPFFNKMQLPGNDGSSFLGGIRGPHHQWNATGGGVLGGGLGGVGGGMGGIMGGGSWNNSNPVGVGGQSSFWGPGLDDHDHSVFLPGDLLGGQ